MLLELKVSNFAIIENLHIQFRDGLNILTGETGAGKSVLLKSLSLLMGLKGSTESIRTGFQQAAIEGSFDISDRPDIVRRLGELGIEVEDHLLVVKRVLAEDKSRVYINGSLSTLNTLRDLVAPLIEVASPSAPLIEMTGQFENRHLLSKAYHLDLLDQYTNTWELRLKYDQQYQEWQNLQLEIQRLKAQEQGDVQRLDYLTFQRNEIQALDLQPNEDTEIEAELRRLKNSSRWLGFIDQAEEALSGPDDSATARLNLVIKRAHEFAQHDPAVAEQIESLSQARTVIEDSVFTMRKWADRMDSDPRRLESLESRLSSLRKLQKKFGPSVNDILAAFENLQKEIEQLENRDQQLLDLTQKAKSLQEELLKKAQQMHKKRRAGAPDLAKSVNAELNDLNMKGVTFHVQLREIQDLGPTGISDAEFMSQTSSKDPLRPLAKFASGGELSRVLLSLKRVVGSSGQPRTYLFDEVDTGVSGPTAEKVGKKLRSIAQGQQVICVTHLPQVAAFGDAHFSIRKSAESLGGRNSKATGVAMEVTELKGNDKISEIARLISGEKITKTSLAHAKELLSETRI